LEFQNEPEYKCRVIRNSLLRQCALWSSCFKLPGKL